MAKKGLTAAQAAQVNYAVEAALQEKESLDKEKEADKARIQTEKEILANLAELGGKLPDTGDIIFEGDTLKIPKSMTVRQARRFLERKEEEWESNTNFMNVFDYRPWDGAYCMNRVLRDQFGSVASKAKRGFWGDTPPSMISIPISVTKKVQVPWGQFTLPALPDVIFETNQMEHAEKGPLFMLAATGPRKHEFEIQGIFNLIEIELELHSIYRGQAFDGQEMPEFVDLSSVDPERVVYAADVERELNAHIWGKIRYAEEFERLGQKGKRAVVIHGDFGTGKTLACIITGQKATAAGYTFIRVRPGRDSILVALKTAALYQPAVVFCEDVDTDVDSDNDRTSITRMLDAFDGVDAKGMRIMAVLTTNYPERIHKGMTRPGRVDAFIRIGDLDQAGVESLVRTRIPEEMLDDVNWGEVFIAAMHYKPAFVTEFADRAISYVVSEYGTMEGHLIGTYELVSAAEGLRAQYDLMTGAKEKPNEDPLSTVLKRDVSEVFKRDMGELLHAELNDRGL